MTLADDVHNTPPAPEGNHDEEIHLPQPTILPLLLSLGLAFALTGMIAPVLGVIGLVITVGSALSMYDYPAVQLHTTFLPQLDNRKLGMWAFLASEVMFFTTLIGMFIAFSGEHPGEFEHAHEVLSLPLATLGTSVLIISSFAVVMALEAIQTNDRRVFRNWMGVTLLFGVMFLSVQAFEWYELMHEGIEVDDIFGTAFFTTTGFHGLHVLGGVAWLSVIVIRSLRGAYSAENNLGIELFGLYWHFVDVVWIVLFTVIYLLG